MHNGQWLPGAWSSVGTLGASWVPFKQSWKSVRPFAAAAAGVPEKSSARPWIVIACANKSPISERQSRLESPKNAPRRVCMAKT